MTGIGQFFHMLDDVAMQVGAVDMNKEDLNSSKIKRFDYLNELNITLTMIERS